MGDPGKLLVSKFKDLTPESYFRFVTDDVIIIARKSKPKARPRNAPYEQSIWRHEKMAEPGCTIPGGNNDIIESMTGI
jgi:hypothetical protein